jgi:hypothetical protein
MEYNKAEVAGSKAEVEDSKDEVEDSKGEVEDSKDEVEDSKDMVAQVSKAGEAVGSKARDVVVDSKASRHEEGNRLKEVANIKHKEVSHSSPKHNHFPVRQG